ncbi:putative magnesium/manganase-dependent protein phosphatase with response regulator receiver domain [Actinoplanes missouriensis 431]|uniref:Putative magnesium/manganase-dependent protein phosphatase with response regulator receiver domain n=1 Tax=Actinoplanes missouriensis (strain ATCC 14538 / DSM 43046 / CBS 188.64 / JCM 3121 / NBRC 102363 / NCIMB 12654 / NRRL B-3342 / UNCC 431) TaxID=512565 RepID=I0GYA1_ACTM4|nr:fused response regulator/phosphatase [Actinoplanes missouriensis]BAL85738.1 putative magnesium/manganase-dependent protein phosphatase with response regulator receiver domain [Actinoplanes missouriensis 431]
MTERSLAPSRYAANQLERLRILLVEDDEGDAFLVRELLEEAEAPFELTVASTLREARERLVGVECVLLDLGLPDAEGIDGLRKLLAVAGSAAVCVLTGRSDEHLGVQAVAEGAQDYLVKGQVDGVLLIRSLRYAVERKRADENARRLREVELLQAESARLERGLLPQPLMQTSEVSVETFYRSGRALGLLGGDFFDVVQVGEDRLHVIVGDVCGHGVDEAALGVELRVAWRALVLAGVPEDQVLPSLEQVLMSERRAREVFATVAAAVIDVPANRAWVRLAGHPPPVVLSGGRAHPVAARTGIVLGVRPTPTPVTELEFTDHDWSLLMYTDGLIEGHTGVGNERLDVDGLCNLLDEPAAREVSLPGLPPWLVARADQANGGPLTDDVAMLMISRGGGR